MEGQERQSGSGIGKNLDKERMGPKNVAIEREYVPREFFGQHSWMTDLFYSDAFNKHANVQSKAVFSYAMTVVDEICGWTDEEKWLGPQFAACMWMFCQMCADRGTKARSRNAGVPEAKDVFHHALRELVL